MDLELQRCDAETRFDRSIARTYMSTRRERIERLSRHIVTCARRTARSMLRDARIEAEGLRGRARQEGRTEGERSWLETALELARRRESQTMQIERTSLTLAIEIARQIVKQELQLDARALTSIVRSVCEPMKRDVEIRISISPDDLPAIESIRESIEMEHPVKFFVDHSLTQGDCIAESCGLYIDARLDTQLSVFEQRLLEMSTEASDG